MFHNWPISLRNLVHKWGPSQVKHSSFVWSVVHSELFLRLTLSSQDMQAQLQTPRWCLWKQDIEGVGRQVPKLRISWQKEYAHNRTGDQPQKKVIGSIKSSTLTFLVVRPRIRKISLDRIVENNASEHILWFRVHMHTENLRRGGSPIRHALTLVDIAWKLLGRVHHLWVLHNSPRN